MDIDQPKEEKTEEKDVSLVDILAVLLRYRRIVVLVPMVGTMLAAVYLFFLQGALFKSPATSYLANCSALVAPLPPEVQPRVGIDIVQTLNSYFSSLPVHAAEFSRQFPERLAGLDEVAKTTYLRYQVLAKQIQFAFDPKTQRYSLTMSDPDGERASKYIAALWKGAAELVDKRLEEGMTTALTAATAELSTLGNTASLSQSALETKMNLLYAKERLIALMADPRFPFQSEPDLLLAYEKTRSRTSTILVVFFSSLFLSILLAFTLNAIRGIRRDPAAMEKLRDAMRS